MKGLLTYRTIQFSMSSGCLPPEKSFLVTSGYYELPQVTTAAYPESAIEASACFPG